MTSTEALSEHAPAEPPAPGRPRWCLGTRLLVTAALAWTVFLVLHVVLTGRWWVWLVLELMPPVTLVAVPLLLLAVTPLARPVRRPLSVLLLATLLAGLSLLGVNPGALGGPPAGASTAGTVKVFVWNTDIWTMSDDPAAFHEYLRAQQADVYLLQEYLYWEDGPIRIDDMARLRAAFPGYQVVPEGEMLVVSRLPIVATYPRPVPATGTDWYWGGKKAQRVDVRLGDRVLSIYNVHLFAPVRVERSPLTPYFYEFVHEQYHLRRAELAELRADVAANPHPVLIAGDFNSPWMDRLVRLNPELHRHDPTGSLVPTTWPISNYGLPRLWRLDWVFATEDVRVARYDLRPKPEFSDHFAQELHVSLL